MNEKQSPSRSNKYLTILCTIFVTFVAFAVNFLIWQVLTPFITENVGTEAYGFVSLAKNIAGYAAYITVALNSHASRFISLEFHRNNLKEANCYFSSTFWGDLVLGSGIMLLALLGIWKLELFFQLPQGIETDIKLLFVIVFIKFWITTVLSVYEAPAYVVNKLTLVGVFKSVSNCVEAAVLFLLFLHLPAKIYFVGIGILIASMVTVFSNVWICRRYSPQLRISVSGYRFEAVKTLVSNGVWASLVSFGSVLNSGLDLIITGTMLTSLAMGQLAITNTIKVILGSLYTIVADAFKPHFLRLYAEGKPDNLLRELKMSMKFSGLVTNLFFAGFFGLGLAYYQLWLPHEDIQLLYPLTVVSISANILVGLEFPLFFIYTLTLKQKVSCMFTLLSGVLNVISMYVLLRFFHMGIYAVVMTTVVLMAIIHLGPHPLYMAHALRCPWHTFYPDIFKGLLSCGVLSLLFKGLSLLYFPRSWIMLGVCILVYSALGTVVHILLVCSREERKQIKAYAKRFLRREAAA